MYAQIGMFLLLSRDQGNYASLETDQAPDGTIAPAQPRTTLSMSFSATPTYQILEFNSTHKMNVPQASSILTLGAIDPVVRMLDRIAGLDSTTFEQCMRLNILCNKHALSAKCGSVDGPGLEIRLSSMDASSIVTCEPDTRYSLKRIVSFNQRFTTPFEN